MIEITEPRLRALLRLDAATCAAMGALLAALPETLAPLLGLPAPLLFWAGAALFPVAALMLVAARSLKAPLLLLVVLGNACWALASLAVVLALPVTTLGGAFTILQALVVAAFAWAENAGRARRAEGAAA